MKVSKTKRLRNRNDYLNFIKRYMMGGNRIYLEGKTWTDWFHFRYKVGIKMTDLQLKVIAQDIIKHDTEKAKEILDSPEWLDARWARGINKLDKVSSLDYWKKRNA